MPYSSGILKSALPRKFPHPSLIFQRNKFDFLAPAHYNPDVSIQIMTSPTAPSPPPAPSLPSNPRLRWGGLPLSQEIEASPALVRHQIPLFSRATLGSFGLRENNHGDLIVRLPDTDSSQPPTPVGWVSKTYSLIQHVEVFDAALDFVSQTTGSAVRSVKVMMSENGERFWMKVDFGENYHHSPDGNPVGLQLTCRNAVDGTSAIRANLGWFRFICANGMHVGVDLGKVRLLHQEDAQLSDVFASLKEQLGVIETDRQQMQQWTQHRISQNRLQAWVDGEVAKAWGMLAASRVWHICQSGQDVAYAPPFRQADPSQKKVKFLGPVPGCQAPVKNIYGVAQALSWVSSHRANAIEAEFFTRQIGGLLKQLHAKF